MNGIQKISSIIEGIPYDIAGRFVPGKKGFVLLVHGATPPTGASNDAIMDFAYMQDILANNDIASFSYNSVGIGSTVQTKSQSSHEQAKGYDEFSLHNRIDELYNLFCYCEKTYPIDRPFFIVSVSMGNHIAQRMIEQYELASSIKGYVNLAGAVFLPNVENLGAYDHNQTRTNILRATTIDDLLHAPLFTYLETKRTFPLMSMYGEMDNVIPYALQQKWKNYSAAFHIIPEAYHPLITRAASASTRNIVVSKVQAFLMAFHE